MLCRREKYLEVLFGIFAGLNAVKIENPEYLIMEQRDAYG
jgi:co-chaperonin GroES (HSP10)